MDTRLTVNETPAWIMKAKEAAQSAVSSARPSSVVLGELGYIKHKAKALRREAGVALIRDAIMAELRANGMLKEPAE